MFTFCPSTGTWTGLEHKIKHFVADDFLCGVDGADVEVPVQLTRAVPPPFLALRCQVLHFPGLSTFVREPWFLRYALKKDQIHSFMS